MQWCCAKWPDMTPYSVARTKWVNTPNVYSSPNIPMVSRYWSPMRNNLQKVFDITLQRLQLVNCSSQVFSSHGNYYDWLYNTHDKKLVTVKAVFFCGTYSRIDKPHKAFAVVCIYVLLNWLFHRVKSVETTSMEKESTVILGKNKTLFKT